MLRIARVRLFLALILLLGAVTLLDLSTSVLLGINLTRLPDWVIAFLTIVLAYYAMSSVEEMKRDRRKERIEKMLEDLYSPLHHILWKAKNETLAQRSEYDNIGNAKRKNGYGYILRIEERNQILQLIVRFNHYMDSDTANQLTQILEKRSPWGAKTKLGELFLGKLFEYSDELLDPKFKIISEKHAELKAELEDLTKS